MSKEYEGPMLPYICDGCKYLQEDKIKIPECFGGSDRFLVCKHESMNNRKIRSLSYPTPHGNKTPRDCPFLNK